MQEIVRWSMGICSSYIAVRLQEDGLQPICLWSDTKREDEDTYRFGHEVAERFNLHVVEASHGEDLWAYWKRIHFLPARQVSQCSREFKIEPSQEWLEEYQYQHQHQADAEGRCARVAFGYDFGNSKEKLRAAGLLARWNCLHIGVWFPLMEWQVTKQQCFGFFYERGIEPPAMYRHFQ
ncbi:MAG TPA: phosphoadenosine phosphosulfate reductase family protein, partial [Nitrososphaera sp.]|nr:phosphoadenosine phosphosulfate reductase family protein [Nitrososphaera sp.]